MVHFVSKAGNLSGVSQVKATAQSEEEAGSRGESRPEAACWQGHAGLHRVGAGALAWRVGGRVEVVRVAASDAGLTPTGPAGDRDATVVLSVATVCSNVSGSASGSERASMSVSMPQPLFLHVFGATGRLEEVGINGIDLEAVMLLDAGRPIGWPLQLVLVVPDVGGAIGSEISMPILSMAREAAVRTPMPMVAC